MYVTSFKVCWWLIPAHLWFSSRTSRKACSCLPPHLTVINSHCMLQKWIIKRVNNNNKRSAAKKMTSGNTGSAIGKWLWWKGRRRAKGSNIKGPPRYLTTLKAQRGRCWKRIKTWRGIWQLTEAKKNYSDIISYTMRRKRTCSPYSCEVLHKEVKHFNSPFSNI